MDSILHILQLVFKTENERKEAVYFIFSLVLSAVIACKTYALIFGDFEIILLSDYKRIITEFFFTGRFVVSLMIFVVIYEVFYTFASLLFFAWSAKYADKLYDFLLHNFNKEEVLAELKTSRELQWLTNWIKKAFKELSVIDLDKGELKPGINFYYCLYYLRKLNDINDQETHINENLAYFPFAITVQILIIFDFVAIFYSLYHNYQFYHYCDSFAFVYNIFFQCIYGVEARQNFGYP